MCQNHPERGLKGRKMEAHHFSSITKSHYKVTFLFALGRSLTLILMLS